MTPDIETTPARLLRADELLRDCRAQDVHPLSQLLMAFDAIYLCCLVATAEPSSQEGTVLHPDPDVVLSAKKQLRLSPENIDLILRLMQWSFYAFGDELPCVPEDAVALAHEVVARAHVLQRDVEGMKA